MNNFISLFYSLRFGLDSSDFSAQRHIERAALSLIHLQRVYKIPLANFSTGILYDKLCPKLSVDDYRLLGYVALINHWPWISVNLWLSNGKTYKDSSRSSKLKNIAIEVTHKSTGGRNIRRTSSGGSNRKIPWLKVFKKVLANQLVRQQMSSGDFRDLDYDIKSREMESENRMKVSEADIFDNYSALCRGEVKKVCEYFLY